MKHQASARSVALLVLALLAPVPALARAGDVVGTVTGRAAGGGVRVEVSLHSGDWIGKAIVAIETAPMGELSPAWTLEQRCARADGVRQRLHRAGVVVRALGRAAWAIFRSRNGL